MTIGRPTAFEVSSGPGLAPDPRQPRLELKSPAGATRRRTSVPAPRRTTVLTRDERELLHQAERVLGNLGTTRELLAEAVAVGDAEVCATAARSLLAIGLFLNSFARMSCARV